MRKGWFKKAKIKWVNQRVYKFEFSKSGLFGSDTFRQRHDENGILKYSYDKPDWYLDMCKEGGFAERFWFCYSLRKQKKFHFWITLKKDVKY